MLKKICSEKAAQKAPAFVEAKQKERPDKKKREVDILEEIHAQSTGQAGGAGRRERQDEDEPRRVPSFVGAIEAVVSARVSATGGRGQEGERSRRRSPIPV